MRMSGIKDITTETLKFMVIIAVAMIVTGAKTRSIPHVYPDLCVGCGDCVKVCPRQKQGAIYIVDGKARIDESECIACNICVTVCSFRALR